MDSILWLRKTMTRMEACPSSCEEVTPPVHCCAHDSSNSLDRHVVPSHGRDHWFDPSTAHQKNKDFPQTTKIPDRRMELDMELFAGRQPGSAGVVLRRSSNGEVLPAPKMRAVSAGHGAESQPRFSREITRGACSACQ
jgi:hypothetical protein